MSINITHMGNSHFENRENLRNAAKNILNKHGASSETTQKIIESSVFDSDARNFASSQLSIIKASSQISLNTPLKETLKYLKNHAAVKTEKEHVFGEIWNLLMKEESSEKYEGELLDFVIDSSAVNIFAAA